MMAEVIDPEMVINSDGTLITAVHVQVYSALQRKLKKVPDHPTTVQIEPIAQKGNRR